MENLGHEIVFHLHDFYCQILMKRNLIRYAFTTENTFLFVVCFRS